MKVTVIALLSVSFPISNTFISKAFLCIGFGINKTEKENQKNGC
jgi:hypothetical protein